MSGQNAPKTFFQNRRTINFQPGSGFRRKPLSSFKTLRLAAAIMLIAVLALSFSLSPDGAKSRPGVVTAFDETIATFDLSSCAGSANPTTTYDLGQNAWATVMNAALPDPTFNIPQRHFQWIAPDFTIAQQADITTATACDRYSIPSTGAFAQVGTWIVRTVDANFNGVASTRFVVRDPASARADVSVSKFGPAQVLAGSDLTYSVQVTNNGPDTADDVTLTDATPANTTFVSTTVPSCADPSAGCNIGSLAPGATAAFTFVYSVGSTTPAGTLITNTAEAHSTTGEPGPSTEVNNFGSSVTTVLSPAPTTCTITCPPDVTVNNNPNGPNPCVAIATYSTPGSSGNCVDPESNTTPPVSCSPASGSTFPVGATTVTCSIQAASCSFTVLVNDTRPPSTPTISQPPNISVNETPAGSGYATVNYATPSATGNCVTVTCDPPSGFRFLAGSTTVTCTARDSSNNTASSQFTVTVNSSDCRLDCPDDKTVNESSPGSGSATVAYSTPVTVGPCPSLTITCTPASGSSFAVGLNPVSCTAVDSSNNVVATCGFAITVNSLPACSITCPANVTTSENPSGSGSATVNYSAPTPTGNCATVSCNPPSGSSFPIGTTTVHCTGTDPAGNTSSCSFTVRVTGGTPCVINCPSNITQPSDTGGCTKVVTYTTPTTSGSCGGDPNAIPPIPTPPPVCNPPSGSVFPVGTTTVTCSTDVGTECSFTITITGTDTVAPVITTCASPSIALADSTCLGPVPNVTLDVEASDNCTPAGLLTITQNPAPGTVVGTGPTTIIVTVKDANNNSSTCTTTFVLFEPTPPTALCKPYTAVLDATGHASITAANVDNGSTDNCAIATRTVTPSTFTCTNKGPNTVTLTVTDPSGNSASCQATVTVVDNTPPTITCPANITKEPTCPTGAVATFAATASDNCGVLSVVCSPASGSIFPIGTTNVTCTATDTATPANTANCSFTVTVRTPQAVIQNMINSVQALAPPLSGQQSQGLVSKLQAALDAVNQGKTNVACNKLADFISQVQVYINNGTLTSAQGQPLLNSAAHVRNTIGCTTLGCS